MEADRYANQTSDSPLMSSRTDGQLTKRESTSPAVLLKRRRISAATSRGVANLTPEQLAKKRANDREAQRAIRERTKSQIDTLEARIAEMTAQKPYQELQDALRQKSLVEAELEAIRRTLSSIQALIRPRLESHTQCGPRTTFQQSSIHLPPLQDGNTNSRPEVSLSHIIPTTGSTYDGHPSSTSPGSSSSNFPTPLLANMQPIHQTPFLVTSSQGRQQHANPSAPNPTTRPLQEDRLDIDYLLQTVRQDRPKGNSNVIRNGAPSNSAHDVLPMYTLVTIGESPNLGMTPVCAVPVRNVPPTCPLDILLLDFLADQRQKALHGTQSQQLAGPLYPNFTILVNPQREQYSHPLSKIFTDMLATFPSISKLPEQVAVLYIMFLVMRWQVAPTQENYDRLPDWMTPRPSQLFHPHPTWIDHLPFPRMRDILVKSYPQVPFDDFFVPFTTTLSVTWALDDREILCLAGDSNELCMSPKFERHVRDLNNWQVGQAFAKAHPALAQSANIRS